MVKHQFGHSVITAALVLMATAGVVVSQELSPQEAAAALEKANAALQTGEYRIARGLFQPLVERGSGIEHEGALGYFETFLATGRYDEGLDRVNSYLQQTPDDSALLHMKGRLLEARGDYGGAEEAYGQAWLLQEDFVRNELALGELYERLGRRSNAQAFYRRITADYQQNRLKTAQTIGVAAKALAMLGDYHEANRVFGIAYDLDPRDTQNLAWWADLFREKFNNADAQRTYEEAIEINPHSAELYVGYARSLESFAALESLAEQAIDENPYCVEAWNIRAELRILDGKYDEAEELLDRVIEMNPVYERSLANLATVYHLRGQTDAFAAVAQQAQEVNPRCSGFYLVLAENCMYRFRYDDAVRFSHEAIARESDNWHAYALLGMNALRLGQFDAARSALERAYEGDPFDISARNSLELMDEYQDFVSAESEHFTLLIHSSEDKVLARPILDLAEECYDSLRVRYPYEPAGKIRLEAYNDHDDFAVRISGLPGIGLLGVCFGDVVAFDTPRAQTGSDYNWADTLWHEIAHVMALGISGNRVPRWFTEGLSVYEEKLARPEWGREMELELFAALDQNLLLSLADINEGFTRPTYPEQVMITYYQSSRMIEFLADRYGFDAIIALLAEFRNGTDLDRTFMTVLGETPDMVEQAFFDNLRREREQYAQVLSDLPPLVRGGDDDALFDRDVLERPRSPFFNVLSEGNKLLAAGDLDQAEQKFRDAIDMFPDYVSAGNPYTGLAEIYRAREDEPQLIAVLEQYLSISGYGAGEARELAGLLESRGDLEGAVHYYRRSMEIEPYNSEAHVTLAGLYERQSLYGAEIGERRIVLALNPLDRAEAYYNLALSLYRDNRIPEAKTEVLRSLELAPGYRDAQKLLLQCVGN